MQRNAFGQAGDTHVTSHGPLSHGSVKRTVDRTVHLNTAMVPGLAPPLSRSTMQGSSCSPQNKRPLKARGNQRLVRAIRIAIRGPQAQAEPPNVLTHVRRAIKNPSTETSAKREKMCPNSAALRIDHKSCSRSRRELRGTVLLIRAHPPV